MNQIPTYIFETQNSKNENKEVDTLWRIQVRGSLHQIFDCNEITLNDYIKNELIYFLVIYLEYTQKLGFDKC